MIFFFILLGSMFISLIVQHFIGPLPPTGARLFLMQVVMFYGALALPLWGMLALVFAGGLMWDAMGTQWTSLPGENVDGSVEIAMGWSIVVYAALGTIMSGFRPLFQRGRWEIHCLLAGLCTSAFVLAEYLVITLRREPVTLIFNQEIWWRIGGAGLMAVLIAPLVFFVLNYFASLVGYDPQPARKTRPT